MRDTREMQGRGMCREGISGMSSEGQRIWSIKICCVTSSINASSFTLLMILWIFLTPLILIRQLTHYDSHTALRQYLTPHKVKSLDQVIFPFYLNFPMMSNCVSFITHFLLIYHLIHHAVLKGTSGFFPLNHWWAITHWSQKCCLVILDSPHVYKEAFLPQRKENLVQFYS